MTKINFEDDVFQDVDDSSLKALADKCKILEFTEEEIVQLEDQLKEKRRCKKIIRGRYTTIFSRKRLI